MIEIVFKNTFVRAVKPLRKRYPNLGKDIKTLMEALTLNPNLGIDLVDDLYKIKMAISDKKTGKSGGARVITYLAETDIESEITNLYLVYIYDKSDTDNISKQDLLALLEYE
jgi:hypothetical protein